MQSIVAAGYVAELVGGEAGLSKHEELSLLVDGALRGADFARMQLYRRLSECSRGSTVEPWVMSASASSL